MTFNPEDIRQDKTIEILREKVNQLESDLASLTTKIEVLVNLGKYTLAAVAASLGIDIFPMMEGM